MKNKRYLDKVKENFKKIQVYTESPETINEFIRSLEFNTVKYVSYYEAVGMYYNYYLMVKIPNLNTLISKSRELVGFKDEYRLDKDINNLEAELFKISKSNYVIVKSVDRTNFHIHVKDNTIQTVLVIDKEKGIFNVVMNCKSIFKVNEIIQDYFSIILHDCGRTFPIGKLKIK